MARKKGCSRSLVPQPLARASSADTQLFCLLAGSGARLSRLNIPKKQTSFRLLSTLQQQQQRLFCLCRTSSGSSTSSRSSSASSTSRRSSSSGSRMQRFPSLAASLLWLSALSRGPWGGEAADFLGALSDLTLGAGLVEDLAGSVASAAELPSLQDLGEAVRAAAGLDADQLQQLTQEQKQHIDLAQSFILSPFSVSREEVRGLPRLSVDLTGGDDTPTRSSNGSSSSSSGLPKFPFSLRGYGLDTAELERLAEAIAEGVANSATLGLRTNPLAIAAAAAAAAARKAAAMAVPSVEKRQDDGAAAAGHKHPGSSTATAVANLVDPLGLLNLPQQAVLQKKQAELQAELQKTLLDLRNDQQLKQQLEQQQQQLEEQQQQLEEQQQQLNEQQQLLQQHQLRQQLQQQLLLEQEKEKQLLSQRKEAGIAGEAADRELFGVRLGSADRQLPSAAAAAAAAADTSSEAETQAAPAVEREAAAGAADKPAAEGGEAAVVGAAAADVVNEGGAPAASSSDAEGGAEQGGEEKGPQRFWSRNHPFGPLQPASDVVYLLKWSLLNPLAILEWKKYSFGQCMDIYKDPDLCANYLKHERQNQPQQQQHQQHQQQKQQENPLLRPVCRAGPQLLPPAAAAGCVPLQLVLAAAPATLSSSFGLYVHRERQTRSLCCSAEGMNRSADAAAAAAVAAAAATAEALLLQQREQQQPQVLPTVRGSPALSVHHGF
ncbi:hypothetical protein Efla_003597 [Eimeria flavescens]